MRFAALMMVVAGSVCAEGLPVPLSLEHALQVAEVQDNPTMQLADSQLAMASPVATLVNGSCSTTLPGKRVSRICLTAGMRLDPPVRSTMSRSE